MVQSIMVWALQVAVQAGLQVVVFQAVVLQAAFQVVIRVQCSIR